MYEDLIAAIKNKQVPGAPSGTVPGAQPVAPSGTRPVALPVAASKVAPIAPQKDGFTKVVKPAAEAESARAALFAISKKQNPHDSFIKTSERPLAEFKSNQKVLLNRKGNEFFNAGNIENAERIFISTGYSDGLTRLGDYYLRNKEELTALKFYTLAHNQAKIDFLSEKIAKVISQLVGQKDG